ncbi:LADA_0D02564g1_1 [Lachancea dasiensis]|uniref:SAGA complex subunit Spt7 n=1 Tax=Lachancea dasiensis TaxID=1072105 RepID=A0A1G4J4N2_9SACH|nr:LADA_0D02564g1_1 [Lachancea dasiensis]
MDSLVPIRNYQKTDATQLLRYTEKLFQHGRFHQFLTPQQLIVLGKIIRIQDPAEKDRVWGELICGNIVLEVIITANGRISEGVGQPNFRNDATGSAGFNDQETRIGEKDNTTVKGVNQTGQSNLNAAYKTQTIDTPKNQDEISLETDFSEVDLENLQQQMSGADFIGNLSLKIRYVLWENAIDSLCHNIEPGEDDPPFLGITHNDGGQPGTVTEGEEQREKVDVRKVEEEEDYDDDYDDKDIEDGKPFKEVDLEATETQTSYDDNGRLIFKLEISIDTLSILGVTNTQVIFEGFNRIYHNFENDRETLLKRLKLEESDKLLETSRKRTFNETGESPEKEGEEKMFVDAASKKAKVQQAENSSLAVNLGSANLSLKHLLATIQDNKAKLNISDYELRHLIMDVRKNRSKWASDDKIGQEELYDACEKVVLELRNFTEHSTAFLNKVSKREAPNYYQVIKKPMDLNTVLKKLKTYQYNSKQGFADDIMLIWKNCLTYNSDPKHFLRTHAIAMQKKSLLLIPLIPDITIRERSEVEKELDDIDKEDDKDDEVEEELSGTGRKGGNVRGIKHNSEEQSGKENDVNEEVETLSGGGDGESAEGEVQHKVKDAVNGGTKEEAHLNGKGRMPDLESEGEAQHEPKAERDMDSKVNQAEDPDDHSSDVEENSNNVNRGVENGQHDGREENSQSLAIAERDNDEEDEEEDEEEEEDGELGSDMYLVEKDDDKDDLEFSTWKNSTASVRAELCIERANLFRGNALNTKAPAILRNPGKMKDFNQLLREYKDQQEAELQRRKLEQESIMKNGFGTVVKQEDEENSIIQPQQSQHMQSDCDVEKGSSEIELDDANFLTEYNVANAVPIIGYKGVDEESMDKEEARAVEKILADGVLQDSAYLANKDKGLNPKMNVNIQLIQEIRHICHKIALIRMLQNPQNPSQQGKGGPNNPNNQIWDSHKYKFTLIDESIDLDPVSRLATRNKKHDKHLAHRLMHKNISRIAMANGFESTQPMAINMLTEIAGEYLSNTIKTIKIHHESTSLNPKKPYEILQMSLFENGIKKPDDLFSYMEAEFVKKNNKLKDIKLKLNSFLKELLRPTLQDLSERNFEDESQSFMTGDFSSEITGEDFFGFKDLGLDREFGVLSNSVPMQLLTFQFQGKGAEDKIQDKKIQPEEFNDVSYADVTTSSIHENKFWNTLRPLLEKAYSRFKAHCAKNGKSKLTEDPSAKNLDYQVLAEDDDLPSKSKSGRPRLPPTGKISTNYRKKNISDAFFAPDITPFPGQLNEGDAKAENQHSLPYSQEKSSRSELNTEGSAPFTLNLPKIVEK